MRSKQIIKYKRREKGKTNYKKRLHILLANKPRIVIRKSLNNVIIQLIEYHPEGDKVLLSSHSNQLKKIGWKFHTGNIPSAYLTGFLFGEKIKKEKKEKDDGFVLDIGLHPSVKGSRIYAALKGIITSNVNVEHSDNIFPKEDRLKGKHISKDIEKEVEILQKKIKEK